MRRLLCVVACATLLTVAFAGAAQAGTSRFADMARFRPAVSCSSPLVLYDSPNLLGQSLSISTRGVWIDLSTFLFSNRTGSYKVGACAVELAKDAGGGGDHYTQCLYAGCVEDAMAPGWNNVISSVYLH